MMSELLLDVRQAARRLAHSFGFTLAAIVILGLGIGANSAIFAVVHSVVLKPLPYPDQERLVALDHAAAGLGVDRGLDMTPGLYLHYRGARTLEEVAIWDLLPVSLTGDGDPERLQAARITHTFDEVLQVPPAQGRWLAEDDIYTSTGSVVVLSDGLWRRRYGADPGILGRTVQINGIIHEVVGVAPPTFAFPHPDSQVWLPYVVDPARTGIGGFVVRGVARLATGVSAVDAQTELDGLIATLPARFPADTASARALMDDAKMSAIVIPYKERLIGGIRPTLWTLLGSVGLVLLIACANVANLFLVRAEASHRELAVRVALGAGRARLVRYFLVESTLLAVAGGALGLALAVSAVRLIVAFGPENLPRLHDVEIDPSVLGFTAAITIVASLLFGGLPLTRNRAGVFSALKDGGRGATSGRSRVRGRNVLVVIQVATALVLLVGSSLMLRSYWQLRHLNPGFTAEGILTFELGLARTEYPAAGDAVAFHRELLDRLQTLPGVEAAAATTCLPLCGNFSGVTLTVEGRPAQPGVVPPVVATRRVSSDYLETMQIQLLSGRALERSDQEQLTGAAVVNEALVEAYFDDENPIGRRVYWSDDDDAPWHTVVGVVGNVHVRELTGDPAPTLYLPLLHPDGARLSSPRTLSYVVRSTSSPLALVSAVRAEIWSMNASLPVARLTTMRQIVKDANAQTAFTMVLLVIAGTVALLLSAVGIYGVVSYSVSQRTTEIGVRMALGADTPTISRMVIRHGGAVAVVGLALGLAGSLVLTRLLRAMLYGVSPSDPLTYGVVAVALFTVMLVATYLPARRAARLDPIVALGSD